MCFSGSKRTHQARFGFTCLNIYMNKYPNNLKLSVLQYKHYSGDSLKVIRGLNDIQKKVCAPNDRGSH